MCKRMRKCLRRNGSMCCGLPGCHKHWRMVQAAQPSGMLSGDVKRVHVWSSSSPYSEQYYILGGVDVKFAQCVRVCVRWRPLDFWYKIQKTKVKNFSRSNLRTFKMKVKKFARWRTERVVSNRCRWFWLGFFLRNPYQRVWACVLPRLTVLASDRSSDFVPNSMWDRCVETLPSVIGTIFDMCVQEIHQYVRSIFDRYLWPIFVIDMCDWYVWSMCVIDICDLYVWSKCVITLCDQWIYPAAALFLVNYIPLEVDAWSIHSDGWVISLRVHKMRKTIHFARIFVLS